MEFGLKECHFGYPTPSLPWLVNGPLCLLVPVHCEMSREHPLAPVPGDVPGQRRQRRELHAGHEEHVQPQAHCAPEVRSEGNRAIEGAPGVGSHLSSCCTPSHLRMQVARALEIPGLSFSVPNSERLY